MSPPASGSIDAEHPNRSQRLVARRRRNHRLEFLLGTLAVIAAVGAWAVLGGKLGSPSGADALGPGNEFRTLPTLGAPPAEPVRALTNDDPLRLWVGGDSLAGALGPALGDGAGETGIVDTRVDYKVSSGLWSDDVRDWRERAVEEMLAYRPEQVVFIVGANDTPIVNSVDGDGDGIPDWEERYAAQVDDMMRILVGSSNRSVFWLGPPTLGTQRQDKGAAEISRVMREVAQRYAPDVTYIDTYDLFSDSDGGYSDVIVDEEGTEIVARIGDGVHFTTAGAAYLARVVYRLLDTRWNLTDRADSDSPIPWSLAPGRHELVPGLDAVPAPRSYTTQTSTAPTGRTTPTSASATTTTVATASTTMPPTPSTTAPPASTVPPTTAPPPSTTVAP